MMGYAEQAIQAVYDGRRAFCKFLSANDTGLTGGHQSGIYISKPSIPILFDTPGEKGSNKDRMVKVRWQDGLETDSRFIYYGTGTRNEYRITNFGRGFPYLRPDFTGALFVFVQMDAEDYKGFVLNSDEEIEQFLGAFGMTPTETNRLIEIGGRPQQAQEQQQPPQETTSTEELERLAIAAFIESLTEEFPTSEVMSAAARAIQDRVFNHKEMIITNPDQKLLDWTEAEYRLFKALEYDRYGALIKAGFTSVEEFVSVANQVLNRRKSRAGKSLEHHLAALFDDNGVEYTPQGVTEGNKKPDFIFPSAAAYHRDEYPIERLVTLAAKTTCKDRWRQVINEADRLRGRDKFLCTLQQGISPAQMDEMEAEQVILVVPRPYIASYPADRQGRIWPLYRFIAYVRELEQAP